jgi:hypothetical protein
MKIFIIIISCTILLTKCQSQSNCELGKKKAGNGTIEKAYRKDDIKNLTDH